MESKDYERYSVLDGSPKSVGSRARDPHSAQKLYIFLYHSGVRIILNRIIISHSETITIPPGYVALRCDNRLPIWF
jgi:hypothetical protein